MTPPEFLARVFDVFRDDLSAQPPTSLRGGNDIDSYDLPTPFDPEIDAPTDAYLERHAFWGLPHLDAQSWRHYLPHLIGYALRHSEDPAKAIEGLVRSLRPPDRFPPRLGSLNATQEGVIRAFLEVMAIEGKDESAREEAQGALEEWWCPNPQARPTPVEIDAMRAVPVTYREVSEHEYRFAVPETLPASGMRDIPSESRRVQTWGGYVCGDAHVVVAVNVVVRTAGSLEETVRRYASFFGTSAGPNPIVVAGARRAVRIDGVTRAGSPAEIQNLVVIVSEAAEIVTLTSRGARRDDVRQVMATIAASFALVPP